MSTSGIDTSIKILTVEQEDDYGFVVTFSDGTTAGYVVEELIELRPYRDSVGASKPVLIRNNGTAGRAN